MMTTETRTRELTDTNVDIAFPKKYNVVVLNDDVTGVGTVIEMLIVIFNKEPVEAEKLTNEIHHNGKGVAGTFSFEMAEQKQIEATDFSRRCGDPLQIIVEKVE